MKHIVTRKNWAATQLASQSMNNFHPKAQEKWSLSQNLRPKNGPKNIKGQIKERRESDITKIFLTPRLTLPSLSPNPFFLFPQSTTLPKP